jgi:hypothetical protein
MASRWSDADRSRRTRPVEDACSFANSEEQNHDDDHGISIRGVGAE